MRDPSNRRWDFSRKPKPKPEKEEQREGEEGIGGRAGVIPTAGHRNITVVQRFIDRAAQQGHGAPGVLHRPLERIVSLSAANGNWA